MEEDDPLGALVYRALPLGRGGDEETLHQVELCGQPSIESSLEDEEEELHLL